MSLYPALTQTNLEYSLQELDPLEKETYQEQDIIQMSNYKNHIYQAQNSKHWKEVNFEGFVLPAQGQAKPYCMKWISWGCNNTSQHPQNKHYAEHEQKTCKVAHCPLCVESWINRQANRSTRRFSKFLEDKDYNFRHIVLSPPQEQAKEMSYSQLKRWLDAVLKVANIKTSAIVFHPFRFQDQKKSIPYISPHFHLLVYGKVTNTTKIYNKTQWLIKNKGDMKNEIDIFNCIRYLLSHAGVRKKTHAIRYLGDISYRKLKVEKEPQEHNCPHCSLPLIVFFIKSSTKSRPPPIDHVGLWDASCFTPMDINDPEARIPFYRLKEDSLDTQDYEEELHYSFEELLSVKTKLPVISKRLWEMSLLDHKTSVYCQTLDSYLY